LAQLQAVPSSQFKASILFYGKVLDQDGEPVLGAGVAFRWNRINAASNAIESGTASMRTDVAGLFSLEGETGNQLSVSVSKPGYYFVHDGPTSFEYADPSMGLYLPDPRHPTIFRLRKRGDAEPLMAGEKLFGFKPDGTQYYINLITGKKTTVPEGDWDVSVRISRSGPSGDRKFDWSAVLEGSGGGLIETNGEFAFQAPELGYRPLVVEHTTSDPSWQGAWKAQLFLKSRGGKIYSRLEAEITPDYNENASMYLKYFVNPSGSRNLEFDPALVLHP
jgi:hypothetical protein